MGRKAIDLTGQKFHRLTVIHRAENAKNGSVQWHCVCDCGKKTIAASSGLRAGDTGSCGCFYTESLKKRMTTHGMTGTSEHNTWFTMKARCYNPNSKKFAWYGARGIKICERWFKFENFLEDMGRKPSPDHSLDRIENDGNYEPGNCRWATASEQARNTRATRFVNLHGVEVPLADLADSVNLRKGTLRYRLESGWDLTTAILRGADWRKANYHHAPPG